MFDLNQNIAQWKEQLRQDAAINAASIDELTDHLRTEVDGLGKAGLTEEEAMLIATRRIGQPTAISAEFRKTNPASIWGSRLFWMVGGYFACLLLNAAMFLPAGILQVIAYDKIGVSPQWNTALSCLGISIVIAVLLAIAIPCFTALQRKDKLPMAKPMTPVRAFWMLSFFMLAALAAKACIQVLMFSSLYSYGSSDRVISSYTAVGTLVPFAGPLLLLILAGVLSQKSRSASTTD